MNSNYTGLSQSYWNGTWSIAGGAFPIALDTEIRGGLRTITADNGETLTDISGLFLQDGMLVYLQKSYTSAGGINYTGGMYYKYTNTGNRSTTPPRGVLANGDSYWSVFPTGGQTINTGNFYTKDNPSGFITGISNYNIISGDLTGQLLSPTINKLQGYSINLTAPPTDGQTLQWDAGSSCWKAGAIPVGGNGGGGLVYYFDFLNTSGINPTGGLTSGTTTLSLLGREYSIGSGSLTSPNLTPQNTDVLVASFITASGNPGLTNIPAGLWDFNIWANSDTDLATQTAIKMVVNIYNPSTSSYRYLSASDYVYLYDGTTTAQYLLNVTIPQTGISSNERIYLQLFGKKFVAGSRTVTFYFDSYRPSHVHTTIPSVAGNGVVKVVNGVMQSPATGIFDSDVDANANIAQSKIQGLTTSLAGLYPKNNPSGYITGVDLSSYLTTSSASTTYYPKNNPSGYIPDAPSNGTGYLRKSNSWVSVDQPISPFPLRSNININYSGSNISSIMYTYTGTTQGYADYSYDESNNLLSISYKASNHSTVLRTLSFGYSGSNITGYIVT